MTNLIVGKVQTSMDVYLGHPRFDAYVQIWDMTRPAGDRIVGNWRYDDLTHRQWQRFRRLQDALARLPAEGGARWCSVCRDFNRAYDYGWCEVCDAVPDETTAIR